MKPLIRYTALLLAVVFLAGAGVAWIEVLTHENILTNPQLKTASGWLTTGLMLLALGAKGWRTGGRQKKSTDGPRADSSRP